MAKPPGATTAAGYDGGHKRVRRMYQKLVDAGAAWCCEDICLRGNRFIAPGSPWHLAHTGDRTGYKGPAHPECNLAERNRRIKRKSALRIQRQRWWKPTEPW